MQKQSQLMQELRPWIVDLVSQLTRGQASTSGGSAALIVHDIASAWHSGALRDDQAPQFLLRSGVRSLTGNLAVDSGVTIDGVDIDVHAADPDAHHARASAGDGISVAGQAISLASGVAGNGLAWTSPGVLAVGVSGLGLGVGVDAVTLTSSSNPGAAAAILASDATGMLTLPIFTATTRVRSPLIDAAANLSIQPAGDLTIDPAGGELFIPGNRTIRSSAWTAGLLGTGWGIQERASGKSHLDIRSIYTDELIATTFTCDQVRVRSGSDWLGESMAIAARDNSDAKVTIPNVGGGVSIYVENAPEISGRIFDEGEYVLIKTIDRTSGLVIRETWGQVYSYNAEAGNRQAHYWITRSGSGNFLLEPGTALIGFGASGGSYIYRTVIEAGRGPYERFATWATNPYTPANRVSRVEIGDIKNAAGDSTTRYGIAAGNNLALTPTTGFSGFSADNVSGMKLYNSVLELYSGAERRVWLTKDYGLYFGWSATNVSSLPIVFTPDLDAASPGASATISAGKSGITNFLTLSSTSYTNTNSAILLVAYQSGVERTRIQMSAAGTGSIYMETTSYSFAKSGGGTPSFQIGGYEAWHTGNDGSGSGLDADLLDGSHASAFAPLAAPHFTGVVQSNVGAGKTDTATYGNAGFIIHSSDATNRQTITFSLKGGATQAARVAHFQTSEEGVANDGVLSLQPYGGNVGVGLIDPPLRFVAHGPYANPATSGTAPSGVLAITSPDVYTSLYFGFFSDSPYAPWIQAANRNALGTYRDIVLNPNGGSVLIGTTGNTYSALLNVAGNIHSSAAITAEGYLQVKAASVPATASGWARIFLRSSDNALCAVMPSGNVRVLANN